MQITERNFLKLIALELSIKKSTAKQFNEMADYKTEARINMSAWEYLTAMLALANKMEASPVTVTVLENARNMILHNGLESDWSV